jgi:hypothetical protein
MPCSRLEKQPTDPATRRFDCRLIPDRHRDAARRALLRLTLQMAAWARGVVINGTITALSMGLLLAWIGVQPALVFAVIEEFYLHQCRLNEDQIAAQARQIIYGRADSETTRQ